MRGLTEKYARRKLESAGFNELPADKKKDIWHIVTAVFSEPMFILLIACSLIYFLLGDLHEAAMLFGVIFLIIGIEIHQSNKTEKALDSLKKLSSPRALVIRDGRQRRIAGREVVVGDIVLINEGDRVPADACLLWSINLNIDESLLTGESMPVKKSPAKEINTGIKPPSGENTPWLYSGTLVTTGQGIAQIVRAGVNTEMGKIGRLISKIEIEDTLLEKDTRKIVKQISIFGFFLCVLMVVFYTLTKGGLIKGFLAGLTLAMAILPEEFPVILTVFLSLGAWRISKKNVLARKMSAVETLGSATVLCVDKTGTLTRNIMAVSQIYSAAGEIVQKMTDIDKAGGLTGEIMEFAQLACKREPFDPMEKAIGELAGKKERDFKYRDYKLIREYPLSEALLSLVNVWHDDTNDKRFFVAGKGAPEAIMNLCHLSAEKVADLEMIIRQMAGDGLRILGVAKAVYSGEDLPPQQHDYKFEFLGFLGLADPIRPGMAETVSTCYAAGIKIVMITGDYPETAISVAKQIGLKNHTETITGQKLDAMNDSELVKLIGSVNIFSRVVPEQKLRIVEALKAQGEIVAMTGDGVNDAPALKAAHIGIAMGGRGTDVAREASGIVLLDDNFSSLVSGVKVGRRIFDNILKAMTYIISVHIPIAGLSLIPLVMKWPIVFFPVHIVFLELVVDPISSVLYEAEPPERNIMQRPPRNSKKPMFNKDTLGVSIMQGLIMLLIFLAVFRSALLLGKTESQARAITFVTLVLSNLALVLASRSKSASLISTLKNKNSALWVIFGGTLLFLGMAVYFPGLAEIFGFKALGLYEIIIALVFSAASIIWYEVAKRKVY